MTRPTPASPPGSGERGRSHGALATGHDVATSIGEVILRDGGTAADAAVASAFALFVLMPEACGLGGDCFVLAASPDATVAINGSGKAPAGWVVSSPSTGAATATVPGAVAALWRLHSIHGSLSWEALLAPAISLAEGGFVPSRNLATALERRADLLSKTASDWSPFTQRNSPSQSVVQAELAVVLREIASSGPRAFYEGEIARLLVTAARADGSLLSVEDLMSHQTEVLPPTAIHIGDSVLEASPPVSQASLVPFALNALTGADTVRAPRDHLLAEALEEGFTWRPLLSSASGVDALPWDWRPLGERARRLTVARGTAHTTSVSVSDPQGLVISLLVSVFHEFGSGFLVPELGFFLNDRMLGFRDTRGSEAERPVHTLSPVIVRSPDGCVGLATPGADAQVQVLSQVIDAVLNLDVDWATALSRPRWRLEGPRLIAEADLDLTVIADLRRFGHDVLLVPPLDHSMGAVTLAGWSQHSDSHALRCFALADGRRGNTTTGM